MRRGPKRVKAKVEAKLPPARKLPKNDGSQVHDLERRLAEALKREAEAQKREADALEQRSATAEILRVISGSPTDVQPVFNAIARSAVRLCEATFCTVFRFDGELLHFVAHHGLTPEGVEAIRQAYPMAPGRGSAAARSVLSGAVEHIPDVHADPDFQHGAIAKIVTSRSYVAVPMLRDGVPIGTLVGLRSRAEAFLDRHIELLKTFADQAVIAIENVRLFQELQARTRELARSVEELKALGEVGQAVSSTLDLETVLTTIVARAVQLSGTLGGVIYEYKDSTQEFHVRATHLMAREQYEVLRATPVHLGQGAVGQAAAIRKPVEVPDILDSQAPVAPQVHPILVRLGYRSLLAVPLLFEQRIIGGLVVWRGEAGHFSPEVTRLLEAFATQSVLAIQNARLFREIEQKGRELEAASQHKSEFLANMSHELRTPLNAIIGFSEVLAEGMFGEVNEKQTEYLRDILESGQHLLSLINDILDLAKIEAGRMELELTDFDLPQAISNALTLVRERAGRRGIALHHAVDQRLGPIRGDERKIKQVLLNLLSNALKFTPEGGRVEVRAGVVDGVAEISVTDTGVGIAPEDQEAVFEEFRQVGTAAKKVEGTGLGLALSRKFVELHGGRIWVKSQVGMGSSFTFTIPIRRA
jgi:two-component system, NtrC family, sensor kinase